MPRTVPLKLTDLHPRAASRRRRATPFPNAPGKVELKPIGPADHERVAGFLSHQMRPRRPLSYWLAAMRPSWPEGEERLGVMLLDGGQVVGVYLAYYSQRQLGGRIETICNLGTWCVAPAYRLHSVRLLMALLADKDLHFTDLTPNPDVVKLNERLGFRRLEGTHAFLVPNLPLPSLARSAKISSDPGLLADSLEGEQFELFERHRGAAGAFQSLLVEGERRCHLICRRDRKRGLPISTLLHVSDPALLARHLRLFSAHLLRHQRTIACLIEERFCVSRPAMAPRLKSPRLKYFRGPRLEDTQIDYLCSEWTCAP